MALMDRIRKAAGMKEAPPSEPPKPEAGQKKQELIDYLQSLPEAEDPYAPFEEDPVIDARQRSEAEKLACDIRLYTREEKLVSGAFLPCVDIFITISSVSRGGYGILNLKKHNGMKEAET